MAQDYYSTLGISKTASLEEIRKAYREMARKYHPDLHPDDASAKKKFQEVQTAFDVLNDPKQKELYDRYGENFEAFRGGTSSAGASSGRRGGWNGPRGSQSFDFEDLFGGATGTSTSTGGGGFADFFRQFAGGGASPGHAAAAATQGSDVATELTIPFNVAVQGGKAQIAIERPTGKLETISVTIPAAMEDGKKIRLRGQGDTSPRGKNPGDLIITIHVSPHPVFKRQGNRLEVVVPITLTEAMQGAQVEVPTPKGTIHLRIPPGTSSGQKLRVKGHGVEPKGKQAGDLYAEVQIVLPKEMPEEDRARIAEIASPYSNSPREHLRW